MRMPIKLSLSLSLDVVGGLDVDSGATRVGVVTYGTTIYDYFHLNAHSSTADVQAAIAALPYRRGTTGVIFVMVHFFVIVIVHVNLSHTGIEYATGAQHCINLQYGNLMCCNFLFIANSV